MKATQRDVRKLSIYMPSDLIAELHLISEEFGVSVSKLLRDSFIAAKALTGESVPMTVFPLPKQTRKRMEKLHDKHTNNRK